MKKVQDKNNWSTNGLNLGLPRIVFLDQDSNLNTYLNFPEGPVKTQTVGTHTSVYDSVGLGEPYYISNK